MIMKYFANVCLDQKSKNNDHITISTKAMLKEAIKNKKLYKKYKSFFMRLTQYYIEHRCFTPVQLTAMENIVKNG